MQARAYPSGKQEETALIPKRILIVDDDPAIIKITKLYVVKSGYDAEEAYDGSTALDKIKSGRFDLAVLDLMLPKLERMGRLQAAP